MDTTMTAEPTAETAPKPDVLGGVVPYLTVDGATKAAEFYARAFGAIEVGRQPVDEQGRTMHVHLHINGGSVMLSDAYPDYGHPLKEPQSFMLHMEVDNVDAWWDRAVAVGCEVDLPLQEMFWGDRYGQLRDPFGVSWSLSTPAR